MSSLSLTLLLKQMHLYVASAMTGCRDLLSLLATFLFDAGGRWLVVFVPAAVPAAAVPVVPAAVLLAGR